MYRRIEGKLGRACRAAEASLLRSGMDAARSDMAAARSDKADVAAEAAVDAEASDGPAIAEVSLLPTVEEAEENGDGPDATNPRLPLLNCWIARSYRSTMLPYCGWRPPLPLSSQEGLRGN